MQKGAASMKRNILELGKTILIVVLFCTLLLLTVAAMPKDMIRSTPWLSTVLQPLAPILGLPEAELTYVEDAQPVLDAAQPLVISVRNSAGRYTAQWDFAALDSAYGLLGGLLGQALDTAGSFNEVRIDRLPQALSQPSISFDYGFPLSAQLLGSWLEATPEQTEAAGQMFILAIEDDQVNLYLSGDPCLKAVTDIQPETMTALLEQFRPDGSRFAFESDSHLTALALLPGVEPSLQAVRSGSPCNARYIESLATALGFNPYDENRYIDSTGVTYFSESNCSLQVSAAGNIALASSSPDRFRVSDATLENLVEDARVLVQTIVGDILGDARIYLSGVTQADHQTTCTFDYVCNGIAVRCGNTPAAVIIYEGSTLTSLELIAADFTASGVPLKVLPAAQAAAIAPAGSNLLLQYDRSDAGELAAGWTE